MNFRDVLNFFTGMAFVIMFSGFFFVLILIKSIIFFITTDLFILWSSHWCALSSYDICDLQRDVSHFDCRSRSEQNPIWFQIGQSIVSNARLP